jgi:hypothetical protein
MQQHHIERTLLRCRLLLTRSAVQRLGYRTSAELSQNHVTFLHECHAVFKRAQKLLIRDLLALEAQLAEAQKNPVDQKEAISRLRYWITLLELTYDSFLWIVANHDRSDLTKFYKGPKHGALLYQNIQSVIELAEQLNQEPEVFAIPLDFSRFTCIGDIPLCRSGCSPRLCRESTTQWFREGRDSGRRMSPHLWTLRPRESAPGCGRPAVG